MEFWNKLLFATLFLFLQTNGNPRNSDNVPDSSNQNSDKCSKVFYEMIAEATNDTRTINETHLTLTLKKITQDLILCIFRNSNNFAKIPGLAAIGNSVGRRNAESRRSSGNRIFTEASASSARRAMIKKQKLRFLDLYKVRLEDRIWQRLLEFVYGGYDNEIQGNYVILMRMMLFDVCESVLGGDLFKGVKRIVDDALEPYKAEKIKLGMAPDDVILEVGRRLRQSQDENCTKDSKQYFVNIPACDNPDMTGMLKCVYYNVTGMTGLQSWLKDDPDTPPEYWEPFKTKLYADVNRLLYAMISSRAVEVSGSMNLQSSNLYWEKIYKVRTSVVNCINLARFELDRIGYYANVSEVKTVNKCLKSANADIEDLFDFVMHSGSIGYNASAAVSALRHDVAKTLKMQLDFYKNLRPLSDFVREQIDSGILEPDDDTLQDKRFAWSIVLEWETSPEPDVEQRLVNLFEGASLTDPNCPLEQLDENSLDSILDNDCWRLAFEDLLIIESAVNAAGLSLQVVFYGEPILMNYIYIVDQELAAARRRLRLLPPFLTSEHADPIEEYLLMLHMNDDNHLHDSPQTGFNKYPRTNKLTKA